MAKKTNKLEPLTLTEIILRGDAETLRQALEARIQIDALLEEREAAYRKIAELENQVDVIVGEESTFPFPEPPMPVAEFAKAPLPKAKKIAKPAPIVASETKQSEDDDPEQSEENNVAESEDSGSEKSS